MPRSEPWSNRSHNLVLRQLKESGLRPTRQRVALARLLLETGPRHVTAEELFQEARTAGIAVSLATVYNTLHQFTAAGLMTEVVAGSGQSYFDTNPPRTTTISTSRPARSSTCPRTRSEFTGLPEPPPGKVIDRIDVVVRHAASRQPAVGPSEPGAVAGPTRPRAPRAAASRADRRPRSGTSRRRSRPTRPMTPGSSRATTRPSAPPCGANPGRRPAYDHRAPASTAGSNAPSRSRRPGPRSGARHRIPRRSGPAAPSAR